MVALCSTVALTGIAATGVAVQVQLTAGTQKFFLVGLPDNAVKESQERVRGAFHALGLRLPAKRIAVNLAPADLSKVGSHYDLPIAVSLLIACGLLPQDFAEQALFMGELGLDGTLNAVPGCLPAALHAQAEGVTKLFVPYENAPEAAWAGNIDVYGVRSLRDILNHASGEEVLTPVQPNMEQADDILPQLDLRDIKGQETAKRAAEIAAAGGHNLLLSGPPGSGKSMLAQRLPRLLPKLEAQEALEASMVHSVAGSLPRGGLLTRRPYRDPHHSASAVALTGGGLRAQPGEMSLAHRGLLFLDELPEFPRQVLETLRQPLETGTITISRANKHVTYPARFQLIAAMNPCPCGYLGESRCTCSQHAVERYKARLSGPLLDRIDLHVSVPAVNIKALDLPPAKEGTAEVAARVAQARALQKQRFAKVKDKTLTCNADLNGQLLEDFCTPEAPARAMLQTAAERLNLSARAYHRVLKVSRTLADLQGVETIQKAQVAEALGFRQL